jgi:hypothetical protein
VKGPASKDLAVFQLVAMGKDFTVEVPKSGEFLKM